MNKVKKGILVSSTICAALMSTSVSAGVEDIIFISGFELPTSAVVASTSFEDPVIEVGVNDGKYFDLGSSTQAHDLENNVGETPVNLAPATEIDMFASWAPYNSNTNNSFIDQFGNPIIGMTDGDFVGVTTFTPSGNPFTDGNQGYQMSDTDGTMTLVSESIDLSGKTNNEMTVDFFLVNLQFDLEEPAAGNDIRNDAVRIYAENMVNNDRYYIVDSIGADEVNTIVNIDDLGLGGIWQNGSVLLPDDVIVRFVAEFRAGSSSEVMWLDNLQFKGE